MSANPEETQIGAEVAELSEFGEDFQEAIDIPAPPVEILFKKPTNYGFKLSPAKNSRDIKLTNSRGLEVPWK